MERKAREGVVKMRAEHVGNWAQHGAGQELSPPRAHAEEQLCDPEGKCLRSG